MAAAATAHAGNGNTTGATATTLKKANAALFSLLPALGTVYTDPKTTASAGATTPGVSRAYVAGRRVVVRGLASGPGTWTFHESADSGVTWTPLNIETTVGDRSACAVVTPAVGTTHYKVTFTAPTGYPSSRVDCATQLVV